MGLPRDPALDSTRAFFREGYTYIGNRCAALDTDVFVGRLMLRPVVCMMGNEAARRFYDGRHFTRADAMPQTTLRLLQDKGSVQSLDGAPHRRRKALFLDMLTGDAVERIGDLFDARWKAAIPEWRHRRIVLHDEMTRLLCDVACAWAGIPVAGDTLTERTREMAAMIDAAGTVGPRAWRALLLRRRAERWTRDAIASARSRNGSDRPVDRLARFRDENGRELDLQVAAVELLNLIRPTVAIARFITFAALALQEHPDAARWLAEAPEERSRAFADEVRRFYPFFPVIGGRVREPFEWRDHLFRRGDWVLLGLHATNHDPRIWGDPGSFRPQRFAERASSGYDLVPQGAGDHARDHRCPGEWFTVELVARALANLQDLPYSVPTQDLRVPTDRFPTLPRSGMRLVVGDAKR